MWISANSKYRYLGPPDFKKLERSWYPFFLFSVAYFSGGTLPTKKVGTRALLGDLDTVVYFQNQDETHFEVPPTPLKSIPTKLLPKTRCETRRRHNRLRALTSAQP